MGTTGIETLNPSNPGRERSVRIVGIAGSLRRDSYNRAALRAAQELFPKDADLEVFDLADIPIFNQDDETEIPPALQKFKRRILAADALLFATPEYNASVSGVLKNAIDWASRPAANNVWAGKPAAIMGASSGAWGTVRAQSHLHQILVHLDVLCLNQPEVMIADAGHRFDYMGKLIHDPSREYVQTLLEALISWTLQLDSQIKNNSSPERRNESIVR
jgi:chromate reductase